MQYSELLADTLMRRYPDPNDYPYRSWCYAQGFMLWGFISLYEHTGKSAYLNYVLCYAKRHVSIDGGVPAFKGDSLDDIMAGSVLAWLYHKTGDFRYYMACERIYCAFSDYPRTPQGAFWHSRNLPNEFWVDGVFMGGMFLLHYGSYIDKTDAAFTEAVRQIDLIYELCRKEGTGLLYHAYSDDRKAPWANRVTGCSPEIWSEGLGWYALILAQAAEHLRADVPGRTGILTYYRVLLKSLADVQEARNGLWYQVVDKAAQYDNWQDTSGSAMFGYSMLQAVRMNIVDRLEYLPRVARVYEGMKEKYSFTNDGFMDIRDACKGLCVQTDYEKYVHYQRVLNANEAVAAVLWFTTEYEFGNVQA